MKLPVSLLLPRIDGVPVLMYHRVYEGVSDNLTITPVKLREQFVLLRDNGYHPASLSDFLAAIDGKIILPPRTVLLTFDDGYYTHYSVVYPLLLEFRLKAVFFIIGNTIDNTAAGEKEPANQKMTLAELKSLDPGIVQLALHSYNHISFGNSSPRAIKEDLEKNICIADTSGCCFRKVLAYPYGQRPNLNIELSDLKEWMKERGIEAAFRIGNKPCRMPVKDVFEIRRIDISGKDSIRDFAIKLKKGKLKPF